ncbi:hypothetical protein P3X46_011430 [Hevea brasiliensis]|uniref:Protein RDM1 n=1 Tax=Hevea brasiliensis TaxID=3981 RepID=A0ABQ9MAS2_HEVBR|nr:hypothetical protein P3X46_011430 [Hevea brasiliensis]
MLRRCVPLQNNHLYLTDSETESDDLCGYFNVQSRKRNSRGIYIGEERCKNKRNKKGIIIDEENQEDMKALEDKSEIVIARKAEKYQQRMKEIPIPASGTVQEISFISWQGLAKSIKQKHEQPLHYLTHKLLREWDESRIGSNEENKPLEDIIDPAKAEATIWVVEQFHRQFSSPQHLAKLWLSDPLHQDVVDPVMHWYSRSKLIFTLFYAFFFHAVLCSFYACRQ